MCQRLPSQVIVDESRFGSDRPESQPNEHELLIIGKVHSHNFLWLDVISCLQPRPILQCRLVELLVCPVSALKDQCWVVASLAECMVLKHVEDVQSTFPLFQADLDGRV